MIGFARRLGGAAVLCGGLVAGQEPGGANGSEKASSGAAEAQEAAQPDGAVPLSSGNDAPLPELLNSGPFDSPFTSYDDYTQRLRDWSETAGERVRLEAIGTSLGGRELVTVAVGAVDDRPAVSLSVDSALGLEGARALLLLLDAWLEPHADSSLDPILLALPLPDPDRAEPPVAAMSIEPVSDQALAAVRVERDYPAGWRSASELRGAGPYPLCRPESGAFAEFLARRQAITAAVELALFADAAPLPWRGGNFKGEDLEALGLRASRGRRASPLRFAHQLLGVPTWELSVDDEGDAHSRAGALRSVTSQLPRLAFGDVQVVPLGGGLWQLDLPFRNAGKLPTGSGRGRGAAGPNVVELRTSGAPVLGVAVRGADGVYEPLRRFRSPATLTPGTGAWALPHLTADQTLGLRLVVSSTRESGEAVADGGESDGGDSTDAPRWVEVEARTRWVRLGRMRHDLDSGTR